MILLFDHDIDGRTYSLASLFEARELAVRRAEDNQARGLLAVVKSLPSASAPEVWGVFVSSEVEPTNPTRFPSNQTDPYWAITRGAEAIFRDIERLSYQQKHGFVWRKQLEIGQARQVFANLNWAAPVGDVAAQLASNLIRKHPFPNGNHRTSLQLACALLNCVGITTPDFLGADPQIVDKLYGRTATFFVDSKFTLQLLRRRRMFAVALNHGYRTFDLGNNRRVKCTMAHCQQSDSMLERAHVSSARSTIQRLVGFRQRSDLKKQYAQLDIRFAHYVCGR